jgi:hypothetical protein
VRPAAGSLASAALKWVRGLTPQEEEYLEKVRSVCARDIVTPPELALAASAIWAYSERGRFAKRAAKSEKDGTGKVPAPGPMATQPTVSEQEWLKLAGAAQAEVERLMILMRSDGPLDQDAAVAVAEAAIGPLAALAAAMTPVGAKR